MSDRKNRSGPLTSTAAKGPDAPIGAPSTWLSLGRLRPRSAGLRFTRQDDYLPTMNDKFGGNKGYIADANENMFVIAQLESQASIDNLDAIVSVSGIDCITFGQNDMASSLGVPGEPGHEKVQAAHSELESRARAAGKHLLSDRVTYLRATVSLLDVMRKHLSEHRDESVGQIT